MKWNEDYLVFDTSGRYFYANGYIGAFKDDITGEIDIAEGYDGSIHLKDANGVYEYNKQEFTPEERKELGDYMIGIWTKFKEGK